MDLFFELLNLIYVGNHRNKNRMGIDKVLYFHGAMKFSM